jgi:long-chain acyl-CoA synthetase
MAELGFFPQAAAAPDRVVLIGPDGAEVTAGELAARANQVSHGLRALGLEKGDAIALVIPNGIEMIELVLGAQQIGLYTTPINHHLVGPEIAYIVNDSDAKVLVGHERFAGALDAAAGEIELDDDHKFAIGTVGGFRPYDELRKGQPDTRPDNRTAGAPMHYTSGTTGKPKGVKRGLADLDPDEGAALYSMFLMLFGIQPEDGNVHIVGSPLYHTAPLLFAGNSLHMGHKVVLMDKWSPEAMLQLIDEHKVTTSHMVPTQFHRLLALPDDVRAAYDCTSVRTMVHAAAPCPIDVKRRMIEWWGDAIVEYYAATEGGGTLVTAKEWLERPGTVGQAWASSEVRILDDDGNVLGTGEVGTIYMLLGQAAFEYKGDQAKTEGNRAYFPDGSAFFTVGDVGELDDEGYLFLRDRKIDMIISGGANIYPAEIEGTFYQCPRVGDVAVFGIPNDDWGEEIKAVIEPAEGVRPGADLERELREFAETNLASYKRPKSYDFIAEMPRDPSGKLYKRKLRDPYWEGRDRAI